jgi:methionyl-tRNA formyltransferase
MNIIFFGSTSDSVLVLEQLHQFVICHLSFVISSIVTQPPSPVGRKKIMTPTPVAIWAKDHAIPVVTFPTQKGKPWLYENEEEVINTLSTFKPDLLVSACYGQKIPSQTIHEAHYGGINVHPSLLPRWRGAYPVPWAILAEDAQTGVTLITLADKFDQGLILAQQKIPLTDKDTAEELRKKLFSMGAELLVKTLPEVLSGKQKGEPQKSENATVARRMKREDGFVPWKFIQCAMNKNSLCHCEHSEAIPIIKIASSDIRRNRDDNPSCSMWIERMLRALSPWPGVWTTIPWSFRATARNPQQDPCATAEALGGTRSQKPRDDKTEKRVKILSAHVENDTLILDTVQLEGKKPMDWKQFEKVFLSLRGA